MTKPDQLPTSGHDAHVASGAIGSLAGAITKARLKAAKSGVTFSSAKPMPEERVEKLARASREAHGLRSGSRVGRTAQPWIPHNERISPSTAIST